MKSTRRGSDSPVHRREKTPRLQIPLDKWPVSPGTPREASGVPCQKSKVGQQIAFWGFQGRPCFLVSSSFQRSAFLDLQPLPLSSHHSKLCLLLLLSLFSRARLCATLWTVAHQAPLCVGFSRQEYYSGLPFPSPKLCFHHPISFSLDL